MNKEERRVPKLRFPGFTDAWEQRKLREVVIVNSGKDYKHLNSGNIPVYGTGGYMLSVDKFLSNEDAIGIGRKGTIDQPYILNAPFWTVDTLFYAVPKMSNDLNFIYGIFQIINWKKLDESTGVPSLSKKSINSVKIFIPGESEQIKVGLFLTKVDTLITLQQRKLDHLKLKKKALLQKMFPKNGETVPELRFPGFTDAWEQRKLGDEFKKVTERNNGQFGRNKWISVSRMFFQDPEKVQSNNIDTRTYVMRLGDIAFEGHPNDEFKFGRFVANDIGDGVVSELFPIYRHIVEYDKDYWKYAAHIERIMGPIFAKSITSSGNSSNKLNTNDLFKQTIFVPEITEQHQIGVLLKNVDTLITLQQRKLDHLKKKKKALLQQMFV